LSITAPAVFTFQSPSESTITPGGTDVVSTVPAGTPVFVASGNPPPAPLDEPPLPLDADTLVPLDVTLAAVLDVLPPAPLDEALALDAVLPHPGCEGLRQRSASDEEVPSSPDELFASEQLEESAPKSAQEATRRTSGLPSGLMVARLGQH